MVFDKTLYFIGWNPLSIFKAHNVTFTTHLEELKYQGKRQCFYTFTDLPPKMSANPRQMSFADVLSKGRVSVSQLVCLCAFQPKDHKMIKPGAFQAEEKELVFDIDMTDYDEVRTCCK